MTPRLCSIAGCDRYGEPFTREGQRYYRAVCPGHRKAEQRAKRRKLAEQQREREQGAAIAGRQALDAARGELWKLQSLSDRANGTVTDRDGLERATAAAKKRLDELTARQPEAKAPTRCNCARAGGVPMPVPEDGHLMCAACARPITPPPNWCREPSRQPGGPRPLRGGGILVVRRTGAR